MSSTPTTINKEQLAYLIAQIERKKARRQLDAIYATIGSNDCQRCGDCCFSSAKVLMAEFLNIYSYIQTLPPERQEELAKRNITHEFMNMVSLDYKCPFLDEDKTCAVYPVRPAQCRFFGLYPEREYEDMQKASREQNRDVAIYYARNHRVLLPEEVMTYDLDQCANNVGPDGKARTVGRPERDLVYTRLLSVQGRTVPDAATFDDSTVRFSYIFTQLFFDPEELEELRVKIMREFLKNGDKGQLEKLLDTGSYGFGVGEVVSISAGAKTDSKSP